MQINISRQNLYLVVLSLVFLLFVLLFSFKILIPEGKEYRKQKLEIAQEQKELDAYEDLHAHTLETLKTLQSENRHIIEALDTKFDPKRFEKQNLEHFHSLTLSEIKEASDDETFVMYEVNTSSKINSPTSFYKFLDAVNKSDWIIGINFPIHFKREDEMIRSSFTMQVYALAKDPKIGTQRSATETQDSQEK
jgi:hypothetical protein